MPEDLTSRAEHLAWCKQRALQYLDADDVDQAWASFTSDLRMHSQTANHMAIELGNQLYFAGHLSTAKEMRKFIEGCR